MALKFDRNLISVIGDEVFRVFDFVWILQRSVGHCHRNAPFWYRTS